MSLLPINGLTCFWRPLPTSGSFPGERFLPLQVLPSPTKFPLQVHIYEPSVFLQTACCEHECEPIAHSSASLKCI